MKFFKWKENDKRRYFRMSEKKKSRVSNNIGKYDRLSYLFEFPKLCLMTEAKFVTLSDVVLNVCGGNI